MTGMDITIQSAFLPHNDPDASLAFYMGSEARNPGPDNGATCCDLEGTTRAA